MATNFLNFQKHAVAGSSKLKATTAGHIFNIRVATDTDNGTIVGIGDYIEPEVYKEAAAPTTFEAVIEDVAANGNFYVRVTKPEGAVLLLDVPLIYETYTTKMQYESNFFNAKGADVRGYELAINDEFELSKEGFVTTYTPAKGETVVVDATTRKLKKKA